MWHYVQYVKEKINVGLLFEKKKCIWYRKSTKVWERKTNPKYRIHKVLTIIEKKFWFNFKMCNYNINTKKCVWRSQWSYLKLVTVTRMSIKHRALKYRLHSATIIFKLATLVRYSLCIKKHSTIQTTIYGQSVVTVLFGGIRLKFTVNNCVPKVIFTVDELFIHF